MLGGPRHVAAFEGLYGGLYDRVISTDAVRRLAPLGFGAVTPLLDLDRLAATVAAHVPPGGTLLDVPSGGAPLLPRLARAGMTGRVVAVDLADAMLDRAEARAARLGGTGGLALERVRADAGALPLPDASADAAVSLNGVHCLPDPGRFVEELGRVVRPGGAVVLVTLVSGGRDPRAAAAIAGGRLAGILPAAPPTRAALHRALRAAGFDPVEDRGGDGLAGLVAHRRAAG
jgi:ubiquinone/menaquinone biosynthesis C-methylase UbiE